MRGQRSGWTVVGVASIALCAMSAYAQDDVPFDAEPAMDQYEEYLDSRGLRDILAAHLRVRLKESSGEVRTRIAERLGRLYVTMLVEAKTSEERVAIEELARELIKVVPESETYELRIDLAKATYLKAEEIVEKDRLRLATVDERAEGERVLRAAGPVFEDIARRVQTRVDALERKERDAADDQLAAIREELAEAVRARSLARYYSGWTSYYLSLLGGSERDMQQALESFGWILQAVPGKAPSIDRLPKSFVRYEHVARAAMGVALTTALKGNDVEAVRWLDEIEAIEDLSPPVREQIFSRRVIILAGAGRWSEAEVLVRRRRQDDPTQPVVPLQALDARLITVLGLEAARKADAKGSEKEIAERVAQVGMGDLVARGEVAQVLDLVGRYGTTPIGDTGFIVQYVRGLQTYEHARADHRASGANAEDPATSAPLINAYREAGELLRLAVESDDAKRFEGEVARARMRRGLALYYAGDLEQASQEFQKSYEGVGAVETRRDALWYAIVALDRAVEQGKVSLSKERDRLALLFLKDFPDSENAAKLLLRQSQAELLSDEEALKVLMAVPPESPLQAAAKRQITRLLYRVYRRAGPADKAFAALRFADAAEDMLRLETERARAGRDEESRRASQSVLLLVRQLTDAMLSMPTPDVARAEAALQLLDAVSALHAMDLRALEPELNYRRLQIALAKSDAAAIERCLLRLRQNGGEFALAGERLMYRRALTLWKQNPESLELARQVVRHGNTVLDNASAGNDSGLVPLRVSVAEAAARIWSDAQDRAMRDLAISLDKKSIAGGARTHEVLKRLGELSESAEDTETALTCWQDLFSALPPGDAEWFEARYHSLRLLFARDPQAAVGVMRQHKVLHPRYGPEPWGSKLRQLDDEMRAFAPPSNSSNPGAAPARQPGGPR